GGHAVLVLEIVAEPVRYRFEHGDGADIGLLLRGVGAPWREGNRDVNARVLRALFDAGATCQHDQVGNRHFLSPLLGVIERSLDALESPQHFVQLVRLIRAPVLLRSEANARTVRAATLVGSAEGGCRSPRGGNQL